MALPRPKGEDIIRLVFDLHREMGEAPLSDLPGSIWVVRPPLDRYTVIVNGGDLPLHARDQKYHVSGDIPGQSIAVFYYQTLWLSVSFDGSMEEVDPESIKYAGNRPSLPVFDLLLRSRIAVERELRYLFPDEEGAKSR